MALADTGRIRTTVSERASAIC